MWRPTSEERGRMSDSMSLSLSHTHTPTHLRQPLTEPPPLIPDGGSLHCLFNLWIIHFNPSSLDIWAVKCYIYLISQVIIRNMLLFVCFIKLGCSLLNNQYCKILIKYNINGFLFLHNHQYFHNKTLLQYNMYPSISFQPPIVILFFCSQFCFSVSVILWSLNHSHFYSPFLWDPLVFFLPISVLLWKPIENNMRYNEKNLMHDYIDISFTGSKISVMHTRLPSLPILLSCQFVND